jgi:hypothetical protein
MRKFFSYGPPNTRLHYYAPREALIERAVNHLLGEEPEVGGHYITIWAPRQTGKTWVMQQVVSRVKAQQDFEVAITTMQSAKEAQTEEAALEVLVTNLRNHFERDFPDITAWRELSTLFTSSYFTKPVILILDEFDALGEALINKFANEFRSIYTERINEAHKKSAEKSYLLHGLALIGVRSVLGIENVTGSPFNVQRSLHVPNLTPAEVEGMFHWYEQESGQKVEPDVIERVFYETQGQPGLTCWLGELLTESYNRQPDKPITMDNFEEVYADAIDALPNNNILNIISKASQEPYKQFVLDMFKTDEKIKFRYDDSSINFLYMNGVIDREKVGRTENYVKFASPFVQKRLFNYFANELFREMGQLYEPFENLDDIITANHLDIQKLIRRYEQYLRQNRDWLLKNAPRRADLRVYEAVYHFNLYMYLSHFLQSRRGLVYPEFPTGNGKIDLVIEYAGQVYGLELKSFTDDFSYRQALKQAAHYGQQLGLTEIALILFVAYVDEANRTRYEAVYEDADSGVIVRPVFVETGN